MNSWVGVFLYCVIKKSFGSVFLTLGADFESSSSTYCHLLSIFVLQEVTCQTQSDTTQSRFTTYLPQELNAQLFDMTPCFPSSDERKFLTK